MRRGFWSGAGAAVLMLIASGTARAEDISPAIRQFDVPATEKLGQQMYAQDEEAWKATDIMRMNRSESALTDEKVGLWVTETTDSGDVVRFIRNGDTTPEAAYDVTFGKDGQVQFTVPANRTLSPDELSQFHARALALKSITRACSNRYNTVALKDPQGDGWLVWAMAATTDPDAVIIGGHYRFTISPDGMTVRESDALSKSCLKMDRKHLSNLTEQGNVSSQLVSLAPLETTVFDSLSYKIKFYVSMLDGKVWKFDNGEISEAQMDAPDPEGFIARAAAGMDEMCRVILTKSEDGKPVYYIGPETKVISATENGKDFKPDLEPDQTASAVVCARMDLAPAPNDYKVVVAGYPLMITDKGLGHPTVMGTLSVVNGQLQYSFDKAEAVSTEVKQRIQKRVDELQKTMQSKP